MRLYTLIKQLGPGHYLHGYGLPDCFGDLQITPFNQVLYHEYSNQHDDHQLRSFQLPSPYRLPRSVVTGDGSGLQGTPADGM